MNEMWLNLKKARRYRYAKRGIGIVSILLILLCGVFWFNGNKVVYGEFSNKSYSYDESQIAVTINTKTIIDITPEKMDFGLLDPGSIGSVYNVTDGTNNQIQLSQFEIENLGSTNITQIWLNVTQPKQNPFGSGNAALYDPGNWIAADIAWIRNPSTLPSFNDSMSYVDRIEFNESKPLVYLNTPLNTTSYGRLRFANKEYFWAINSSGTNCDASTNQVYLILGNPNEPHNVSETGDINLRDGDEVVIKYTTSQNGYSIPSRAVEYPVNGEEYVFLVATDCSHIRLVKWNRDALPGTSGDLLSNKGYVFSTTNSADGILPGQAIAMNIEMRVPYGVVANSYTGYLTVIASTW